MCEDVLGVVMVMGMRLGVEMEMWVGTGTDTGMGTGTGTGTGTGAVHSEAPALLHTHCCAEPCSGGNQRSEQWWCRPIREHAWL